MDVNGRNGLVEGIRGGYASAKQNFFPAKQELLLSEITGLLLDAHAAEPSRCRRTRRG
jgi:hypothetical protein